LINRRTGYSDLSQGTFALIDKFGFLCLRSCLY
jgi:hypothetical protein